jgi:hypothetical protein
MTSRGTQTGPENLWRTDSAHNQESGWTDLHLRNNLIQEIAKTSSTIKQELRIRKEQKLTDVSKRLYHLHISRGTHPIQTDFKNRTSTMDYRG